MNVVYIVEWFAHGDAEIVGVFGSEEDAKAYIEEKGSAWIEHCEISEWGIGETAPPTI